MKKALVALTISLAAQIAIPLHAESGTATASSADPAVYALVAAVGDDFSVVEEVQTTGTHLSPYRRSTSKIPDNLLNRLALHSLDKAVATIDPSSTRLYLSIAVPKVADVALPKREDVALAAVVSALMAVPEHVRWDRIIVALPAYRALAADGVASKLQGFGIFSEPLCQAGCAAIRAEDSARLLGSEPPDGVPAITSDDKETRARAYVAPFSYISIWILDPKTLAVLDVQRGFDNQKLAEPRHKPQLDFAQEATQRYVAGRIADLIDRSVTTAVMRSEANTRRGTVEVIIKEVKPADSKQ